MNEADILHRAGDVIPVVSFVGATFGGAVAWMLRKQTAKIKTIFVDMTQDHNKNGAAHIVVAGALRAERGQLFQQIGEQINDQNVTLARIEGRVDVLGERLGSLIEAHNATSEGADCGGRQVQVRPAPDHDYRGPFRRKDDPKGRA